MSRILALAAAVAAAVAVAATPASARAATVPHFAVSGIETGVPQNETSPFAGTAFSPSAGAAVWSASVVHTDLSGCMTTDPGHACLITGGTFTLKSLFGKITGTFSGGTITPEQDISGCQNEKYDVSGAVSTNRGPAQFDVVLTHYQTMLLGRCVTYFATVTGTFG
jgi:hypothetical protein